MALYLSQSWHDRARELAGTFPEHPGLSVRMACVVSGGPDGDLRYFQITENGRVVAQALGDCENPDFTFTVSWADSVSVQKGELDPNVAFMQGRMKVSGNMGKVMALLPLTLSPEYQAMQAELQKQTEYS